ncbi:MAG: transglutaminase family protein [Acidobacteriota bacterium]
MSIHVALSHITHYRYDRAVQLSPQLIRLRPAPHCRTPILSYSQRVTPEPHFLHWQQDPQSNYVARVTFPDPVHEFRVEVTVVAEMAVYNPFDFFLEPYAEQAPFAYESSQLHELEPFRLKEPLSPLFESYLKKIDRTPRRTIDFLVDLNQRLSRDIGYVIRLDPGVQTTAVTLEKSSGSCRDTTWLLVQLLRHLGLAARFVSGYLIQLKPDVKSITGPTGTEIDFTDLHAWCEVFLPGAGWIGLDPTSGLLAGEGHIPLACSPDPSAAAPITGMVEDCEVSFEHTMSVERIYESPRVTAPYSDEDWQGIVALGLQVDADLKTQDVRLTMGGEPTFVSATDRDGAEWNTTAVGPTKRHHGADLLFRLKRRFSEGAFLHFGQGKWYPGEQLPRWSLGCYWRRDGEPAWTNEALFADEDQPDGSTSTDAEAFIRTLAETLGVTDAHVQPGYEDVWYYLWRERKLPTNVDPFDARLDDELERDRLRRVFTQGLDTVVGYALPLAPTPDSETPWRTGPWLLRNERLYLLPGDSPMGLRLPLDSLPWVAADEEPLLFEPDPLMERPPLPRRQPRAAADPQLQVPLVRTAAAAAATPSSLAEPVTGAAAAKPADAGAPARVPARHQSAPWLVRTALCVEPRGGVLYVFLPPIKQLEQYLDLVSAIETTAARLHRQVLLEGYPPPHDPRLRQMSITPDPGVLEVNIEPATSWSQLVEHTTILYDEAHQAGLSSEKFMLDGRHTGTGGGNHLVLGGATPADSPFLRRPDLLRSLVAYWHNHPSLSYLFSGLFIGPTSQAPRVDEARNDSIYELDIAFSQLPGPDVTTPPWTVDRVLRNLLIDVTGNTHRAEFCIDKLYAPDSASGRRGLVEMRAFEMPPHSRMSLAQQLLLRALVVRFWRTPYTTPLVRWGTDLHDRFMLPYFVHLDFEDVLEELRAAGSPMPSHWFAPHFEFKFPRIGEMTTRAIHLTLRQALEPWHVLGEEATGSGTARYVDSSVERIQALVTGLTGSRYVITCNGRPLPLQPTGRNGEAVAGVRFRAWQPPLCLHPTIPVQAPLTFDIVDTWMQRSAGGCQYHVMDPGGVNPPDFPVNSYAAESRRLSRFTRLAHTPGRVSPPPVERTDEFPYTLDLRTPSA